MSQFPYIIVLTADPVAGLSDATVEDVRGRVAGAGPVKRLSASAAEIGCPQPVMLDVPLTDVNCVPVAGRRKRLLIADMDSTMIPVECIDEIADFAGFRAECEAITEPAMRGEMSFDEALRARVALMKGLPQQALHQVYAERVALSPGARTAIQTLRQQGVHCALVSGGFTFFTERVAVAAGFHEHHANRLVVEDDMLAGTVEDPILGREAKVAALKEMTSRLGLGLEDAIAIGDGANDLAMIGAAGTGVAYRAKPILADAADARINHGDLTALLYLQGLSEDEFVTG